MRALAPIARRPFGWHSDTVSILGLGGYHLGKIKTTAEPEGEVGRKQHGFPLPEEVAL